MIEKAKSYRTKYESVPNIKADYLKLFADGVLEGDPLSTPPTLPNAAMVRDYLQPIFKWSDEDEWVRVAGYVDLNGPACWTIARKPKRMCASIRKRSSRRTASIPASAIRAMACCNMSATRS
ncbi:MAG: hypothetical protein R3C54_17185 [Parvularculaceae bacterium]